MTNGRNEKCLHPLHFLPSFLPMRSTRLGHLDSVSSGLTTSIRSRLRGQMLERRRSLLSPSNEATKQPSNVFFSVLSIMEIDTWSEPLVFAQRRNVMFCFRVLYASIELFAATYVCRGRTLNKISISSTPKRVSKAP